MILHQKTIFVFEARISDLRKAGFKVEFVKPATYKDLDGKSYTADRDVKVTGPRSKTPLLIKGATGEVAVKLQVWEVEIQKDFPKFLRELEKSRVPFTWVDGFYRLYKAALNQERSTVV